MNSQPLSKASRPKPWPVCKIGPISSEQRELFRRLGYTPSAQELPGFRVDSKRLRGIRVDIEGIQLSQDQE